MYLISIYFDDKTNKQIQRLINKVAEATGNHFMIEGQVPPHITISAFEAREDAVAICAFEKAVQQMQSGEIEWMSAGQFLPSVIFLAPVLNRYLQNLAEGAYQTLQNVPDVVVSPYYKPFQWFPHTTIGKNLSAEEMKKAFQTLQESFSIIRGQGIRIGLAKPNPHRDILIFDLECK